MTERGKYLSELRRSSAAGIQDHRPSRSQLRRWAIEEGLTYEEDNMSVVFDDDYIEDEGVWIEPTVEDLQLEAEEDYQPDDILLTDTDEDYTSGPSDQHLINKY